VEYKDCVSSGKFISTLEQFNALAGEAGINSTPNFLINGELAIVGNREYSFFQEEIELALASQTGE
jgi:predicted DsbA family dithiol-disulfide isomerase